MLSMFRNAHKLAAVSGRSLLRHNRQLFSADQLKATRNELVKVLSGEIEGEMEDATRQEYIDDFIKKNGWKLETNPNSIKLQLVKQVGSTNVRVIYDAKAPQLNEPENEGEEEAGDQGDQNVFEFFAVLDKNIKNKVVLGFAIIDGDMSINRIFITDNPDAIIDSEEPSFYMYSGPEYDSLAETVQRRVQKYVQQFGINEELGNFLEESSQHREASLYKQFLGDLKDAMQ